MTYQSNRLISDYPHCAGRGVLVTFAVGIHGGPSHSEHRVDFNRLMSKLTPEERSAWDRQSVVVPADEHGIHPEHVEQFFKTLLENSQMAKAATAAAPKKRGRKPKTAPPDEAKTQQAFDGTFSPQDERLEQLAIEFDKTLSGVTKANDKKNAAYDALKAEMREQGVEVYHCYKMRAKVLLAPEDAKVKLVQIKGDEPTPYQPGAAV